MPISEQVLNDITNEVFQKEAIDFIFDDELYDEDAIKLASALKKNSYIKKLDLGSHAIGDIGVQALAKVKTLEELTVSNGTEGGNNHITATGATALAKSHLKKLNINGNLIGDEGIKALANSETIIQLFASGCGISSKGASDLFRVNSSIKKLGLSCNEIGDEGLNTIALNTTLRALDLSNCSMTERSSEFIAQNTSLRKLNLCGNKLGSSAKFLAKHENLESLNLSNCNIVDEAINALAKSKVKKLSVSYNKITLQGIRELAKNTTIADLDINDNEVYVNGLKELMEMQSLMILSATNNKITEEGVNIVKETFARKEGCAMQVVNLNSNRNLSQTLLVNKKRKSYSIEVTEDESAEHLPKKQKIWAFP